MYNTHTLNNGLRIIHLDSESPVVYCGYAVGSGARHEKDDQYGLAHFCEHTTFKGTERLSSLRVINALERYGGDLNAFTTKEDTFYYAAILRDYFPKAVELLTDILFHSTYPQQEINKEVEVICDEIESYLDTPSDLIYDEFENEIFRGTSLGHSILGEADRVRKFTTEDALAFTRSHYVPSNCVFYVHGHIDFNRLVRMLEKLTPKEASKNGERTNENGSSEKPIFSPDGSFHPFNLSPFHSLDIDSHQSHVMLGTALPRIEGKDAATMMLLNNIIGGPSMNSRLNLALRERRGLVYSVDSSVTSYSDCTLWTIYFGCNHEDVKRCLRLVHNELDRLQQHLLSPTALRNARQQLKGQIALASENRENFSVDMAKQYLRRGTLKSNERVFALLNEVTATDIQDCAIQHLSAERLLTLLMK